MTEADELVEALNSVVPERSTTHGTPDAEKTSGLKRTLASQGVSIRKVDGVYVNANQEALCGHTVDDADLHVLSTLNFLEQNYGLGFFEEELSKGRTAITMNSWSLGSELKLGRDGIVVLWDSQKRMYQVASTLCNAVLPIEQEQLSVKIMSVDTVSDAVDSVSMIQIFWPEQPQLYVKAANHLFEILKNAASDEAAKTAWVTLFKQIVELPVQSDQEGGASLLWLNFDLARGFLLNDVVRGNETVRILASWKIEAIRKVRLSLQPTVSRNSVGATSEEEPDSDEQGDQLRRAFLRVLKQYEDELSLALSRKI